MGTRTKECISLLLGAGFSIPAGYPSAKILGEKLVGTQIEDLYVAPNQTLAFNNPNNPIKSLSTYRKDIEILLQLIRLYHIVDTSFNYETFYDFYQLLSRLPINCYEFKRLDKFFQQLVTLYINTSQKDVEINSTYKTFVNKIISVAKNNIVHVHTLNHDDLFEMLFQGHYSDGYTIDGSPFNQNIPYYNGNYSSDLKLYKLHGSFNQYIYEYQTQPNKYSYIKCGRGVNLSEIVNIDDGDVGCNHILVPDFLTGTNYKQLRIREPHYYNLFCEFENNLKESSKVIIIGYSGGDPKVNEVLEKAIQSSSEVVIVNPSPNDNLNNIAKKINARIVPDFLSPDSHIII